jgi:putative acetyltransferase
MRELPMTFPLRPFLPTDTPALAEIFREAIYELAREDYDEDQLAAWMDAASDEDEFGARLESQLTLVAVDAGEPAAFISLKDNTHIDLIYVLPGFAREGAGSALMDAIIRIATARGAEFLTADVSDNAKAFFETFGFVAEKRNMVMLNDEVLGNTSMRKTIKEQAKGSPADGMKDQIMRGKP